VQRNLSGLTASSRHDPEPEVTRGGAVRMDSQTDLPLDREQAISALFATHWDRLVRLAALLVDDRGTAEDIVQDAFSATYEKWSRLRDTTAVLAYLQTSVVNGSRSRLRRRGVARRRTSALSVAPGPSAAEEAEARAETHAVRGALATLPPRQRQVLVLRYYLDLNEGEIADVLRISRGSVKAYASRGLDAIEAAIEEGGVA
jgi:RNA polymerase sigma-70 factor (sigma-E family)